MNKRKNFSVEEKAHIIFRLENNEKNSNIATEFGVSHSTISTIWKNRDKIKREFECERYNVKKIRGSDHEDIDNALLKWFKTQRNFNIPINGPILQEKANDLAKLLGKDFSCSSSWIQRFRVRHNITFSKINGESASVNLEETTKWMEMVWPKLREVYDDAEIYNCDETGLFFKMLPDKTFKFKGETCSGGKMSKERLTVLVCANMTGTSKKKLFVIGKSKTPRCFKNVKSLPVIYEANKRAWMTSELWDRFLRKWDSELKRKGEKILLLVDNCQSHTKLNELHCIKLVFLPPNCTSVLQPMDQGIIKCLKTKFRKLLVLKMIDSIEHKKETKLNVLDAILLLTQSWNEITLETIKNCFSHVGFLTTVQSSSTSLNIQEINCDYPNFENVVGIDTEVATTGILSDEDIVNTISKPNEEEEEEEEEITDEDKDYLTVDEAYKSLENIVNFSLLNNIDLNQNFNSLKLTIQNMLLNDKSKQLKITDFLK